MDVQKLLSEVNAEESGQVMSRYSPLGLAYLGDAVFELCVRALILSAGNAPANRLHAEAKNYVAAAAQSEMYGRIFDVCSEEERSILKRGRNAKSITKAKNATISEYRHATGLEALFGYLLLTNRTERIMELFALCAERQDSE